MQHDDSRKCIGDASRRIYACPMSSSEIDTYLKKVAEPQRSVLLALRSTILSNIPDAEECISYKIPAFRVDGHVVAGFAAFKSHMSYLPFSGAVLPALHSSLEGHVSTKSALHFTDASPLSDDLVALLLQVRLAEIAERGH
jgi:uncharacterized protein YdhG (YjbR/CyaY superfamily)